MQVENLFTFTIVEFNCMLFHCLSCCKLNINKMLKRTKHFFQMIIKSLFIQGVPMRPMSLVQGRPAYIKIHYIILAYFKQYSMFSVRFEGHCRYSGTTTKGQFSQLRRNMLNSKGYNILPAASSIQCLNVSKQLMPSTQLSDPHLSNCLPERFIFHW